MAKNIVFCADGTWNGPEERTGSSVTEAADAAGEVPEAAITNVLKLFANLAGQPTAATAALKNEQERVSLDAQGNPAQVAKYIHGVGDSSNPVIKALGGVFGVGLISRVIRGYTFISREYEPGDAIYICGFSRGAYTARALAGTIAKVGLLDRTTYDTADKEKAYRLGLAAWAKSKTLSLEGHGLLDSMARHILDFSLNVIALPLKDKNLVPVVPIKAIGVWDTVGSMGIPKYVEDQRYDVFRFADLDLSPRVEHGFHAMAIDEMRVDFPVTRWSERAGVEEVWFVGAHADIGGGYKDSESRLSDVALGWMVCKLGNVGLRFSNPLASRPQPLSVGPAIHEPWTKFPFDKLMKSARKVEHKDTVHDSVIKRWKDDSQAAPAYRPEALKLPAGGALPWKVDTTTI